MGEQNSLKKEPYTIYREEAHNLPYNLYWEHQISSKIALFVEDVNIS